METIVNNTKTANLSVLNKTLQKEKRINNLASSYYRKQNIKLVIPAIIITGLSSICSFLASSDIIDNNTKNVINIGVGILTIVSAMLQSMSNSLEYNIKSEMFRKSADMYDKLITKIDFEIRDPNESDFLKKMEEKILFIKGECKYLPPIWMEEQINDKTPLLETV